MAKNYVCELGFDFEGAPDPDNQHLPVLAVGFALDGEVSGPDASQEGDSITFKVFNITSGAPTTGYSILSEETSIAFRKEETQQSHSSPFEEDNQDLEAVPIDPVAQSPSESVNFEGGPFGTWRLADPRVASNPGSFLFTVWLKVEGPNSSTRTFRVDPEMIVWGPGN